MRVGWLDRRAYLVTFRFSVPMMRTEEVAEFEVKAPDGNAAVFMAGLEFWRRYGRRRIVLRSVGCGRLKKGKG